MKYLLVVAVALVAFVAADDEWKPTVDKQVMVQIMTDCEKETGVTKEQLRQLPDVEHSDDAETLAYALCRIKKLGVFTEEKGWSVERLMSQLDVHYEDVEKVRDIVANCVDSSQQHSTPALRALRGQQCLLNSEFTKKLKERKDVA